MNLVRVVPRLFLLLASVFAAFQMAYSEMRPWTARGGRPVQADLVAYDPGTKKVTLKLATGSQVSVAFDTLTRGCGFSG